MENHYKLLSSLYSYRYAFTWSITNLIPVFFFVRASNPLDSSEGFIPITFSPNHMISIDFAGVDITQMKKFLNPHNNITYLLYSGTAGKMGYVIYDDFILDTYGIREWVELLPTTTISMNDLYQYTIVGL